ncbi:MAG: hypothetical protein WBE30_05250 [Candidatus Cybelea sp.]
MQLIGIGCASFDYGAQFILSERSESKGASAEDDKGVWVIGIGCAPFDYGAARLRSDDKGVWLIGIGCASFDYAAARLRSG